MKSSSDLSHPRFQDDIHGIFNYILYFPEGTTIFLLLYQPRKISLYIIKRFRRRRVKNREGRGGGGGGGGLF